MKALTSGRTRSPIVSFTRLLRHQTNRNPNPFCNQSHNYTHSPLSNQCPHRTPPLSSPSQPLPNPNPNPNPNFNQSDFIAISHLLTNPNHGSPGGPPLETALDKLNTPPSSSLLLEIFSQFGSSSPKSLLTLFLWAEKRLNSSFSVDVLNSMIKILAKAGEFGSAWSLIVDRVGSDRGPDLNSFAVLIRWYSRKGMVLPAIQTYEYASNLDLIRDSNLNMNLFEILLSSLCKEGRVRSASDYLDRKRRLEPCWVASERVYNLLLNGWFRARKCEKAEQLWVLMRKEMVKPSHVTYGILVEGYCRMHRVEVALELVSEMTREGIGPNIMVYNQVIDALGEEGRLKEALGMLERFTVSEPGPDVSTYNSLVKGFCKAGDLVGASKILKMMSSRGCVPTSTTYNFFFWHFKKYGKTEEGLNLYNKMIESGHIPDGLTYRLILKMLCEQERLSLAMQVIQEMRARGCNLDSTSHNRLTHLLCKMHRFDEAFREIEDMVQRGIVPWYITYQKVRENLEEQGMSDMSQKLCDMMVSGSHFVTLPNSGSNRHLSHGGTSPQQRAEATNVLFQKCKGTC